MRSQACEPCTKRKVRCDREEPCSNCKRRKQDRCNYPKVGPVDKIKRLEALVRSLGGNPDDDSALENGPQSTTLSSVTTVAGSSTESPGIAISNHSRSKDPVILEEDGQQHYLESRAWLVHGPREGGYGTANDKNPLLLRNAPHAFESIISSNQSSNLTAAGDLQNGINVETLWTIFKQRINPVVRIFFSWEVKHLESTAMLPAHSIHVKDAENALVSSIYLASIVSLSDAECKTKFHQPKSTLLFQYQVSCEQAIARTNILCMKNIVALKALVIYLMVSMDRLSTQSLWTLMGLAVRTGEKLGIHRDGTLLGLSPSETENRRRLWWQMQYLDLILAIRLGATPLTLMAGWDVKLPLNIEDEDLYPDKNTFPEERKGLTSMSYCLFTYYVLEQQRQYHTDKGRFELSWSTNQSVPIQTKEAFIDRLEDGLNKNFLQYCDPIEPVEILLQLVARALICVFRQRILLTDGDQFGYVNHEHHVPLVAASMKLLEYAVIMHSHQLLKGFQWLTINGFPWHAFMVVLVEASHESDMDKCQRIWTLLSSLYAANASLLELTEDRRRTHAAELVVAAWRTCQSKGTIDQLSPKPDFVISLENRLAEYLAQSAQVTSTKDGNENNNLGGVSGLQNPQSLPEEQDANILFDMNFQDIDWAFWNSID